MDSIIPFDEEINEAPIKKRRSMDITIGRIRRISLDPDVNWDERFQKGGPAGGLMVPHINLKRASIDEELDQEIMTSGRNSRIDDEKQGSVNDGMLGSTELKEEKIRKRVSISSNLPGLSEEQEPSSPMPSPMRRLSIDWDDKALCEKRTRKMSVSTYITDGRGVRRLSTASPIEAIEMHRKQKKSDVFLHGVKSTTNSLFVCKPLSVKVESMIDLMYDQPQKKLLPKIPFENTFKIPEKLSTIMNLNLIKEIIGNILFTRFKGRKYSQLEHAIGRHTKETSNEIITALKRLPLQRYKIVCVVSVVQTKGQGALNTSRCLMSQNLDTWTDATYQNSTLVVNGAVYLMCFE